MPNTDAEREHGLSYIIDAIETVGHVTTDDVMIFMKDLNLPPMGREELEEKFRAVGANTLVFTKLPHFFQFILGELEKHSDDERIDAFKVFDEDDTGFIEASELRGTLSDLGNNMLPGEIDQALRMSDMDGDGTVLYEEVVKITGKNEEAFEYRPPVDEKVDPESGFHSLLMAHARAHARPSSQASSSSL